MMAYAVYGVVEKWQLLQMSASCAVRDDGAMQQPADLCRCRGGIMRIRRTIIIPAILALSAAGSILAGSAVPAATAAHAPSTHVVAAAPATWYHG
jgi:hypothetical protein